MNNYSLLVFLLLSPFVGAQDLLSLLQEDSNEPQVVTSIFKDSRVVNAQSSKQSTKGEFKLLIQHRFGTLNSGFYNLWGIDNSQVRMGLDYGISERCMVSLGRSSTNKQYDFSLKGKLAQQTTDFPLVISVFSALFVTHPSPVERSAADYDFLNQLSFANQLILARKFSSDISLVLLPTHIHRNVVEDYGQPFDPLFLGVGGRYKITKKVSINGEYFYALNEPSNSHKNMLSVGFDIETGGHVFSLHLSNSRAMNEAGFLTETTGDWLEGDIYFGFNISRVFAW
ncbi:MAG: DUF5777 family beta-barrel protein [Bacteroidota bacterium]|nr:DUF5777 family beta-barrel protein [Bacteroidota bacterium]